MDGGHSKVGWGHGKVVRGGTETQVVSHVVDSVDTSLVSVGVGPGDSSVSVASFLLGAVDVGVTEGEVLVLVLSLVLRTVRSSNRSNRSSLSNDWGGDGLSDHWSGNSLGIGGNHRGGGGIQGGDLGSVGKVGWSRVGCSVGE